MVNNAFMRKDGGLELRCGVAKVTILLGWDVCRDECFALRQCAVVATLASARNALMAKRGGFEGDCGVA